MVARRRFVARTFSFPLPPEDSRKYTRSLPAQLLTSDQFLLNLSLSCLNMIKAPCFHQSSAATTRHSVKPSVVEVQHFQALSGHTGILQRDGVLPPTPTCAVAFLSASQKGPESVRRFTHTINMPYLLEPMK